jgi:hypothetical protein
MPSIILVDFDFHLTIFISVPTYLGHLKLKILFKAGMWEKGQSFQNKTLLTRRKIG